MARLGMEELDTATPIAGMLPGMLQEDEFAQRFSSAFDTIFAPILATLDCIDSYFDPWLAPKDFLEWLATWVAVELDELLPPERQRLLVSEAVRLYRMRGTAIGLAEWIAIYTGLEVEIAESGGSTWSAAPGGNPPGENYPRLAVKLITSDPASVDINRVNVLVAAAKPAHIPHTVEIASEESGGVAGVVEGRHAVLVEETVPHATEPAAEAAAPSQPRPARARPATEEPPVQPAAAAEETAAPREAPASAADAGSEPAASADPPAE